jgi:hypothetical protein
MKMVSKKVRVSVVRAFGPRKPSGKEKKVGDKDYYYFHNAIDKRRTQLVRLLVFPFVFCATLGIHVPAARLVAALLAVPFVWPGIGLWITWWGWGKSAKYLTRTRVLGVFIILAGLYLLWMAGSFCWALYVVVPQL